MTKERVVSVPKWFEEKSHLSREQYESMYKASIENPELFWSEQSSEFIDWFRAPKNTYQSNMSNGEISWFSDGQLNISHNCIDRHLKERAEQFAIIWEGDDASEIRKITYRELHREVCILANGLIQRGVKKGDRVCIYMPMIPEAAFAMLACSRIGAIHSVVFGGFSPQSLKDRILDSDCRILITADQGIRGGKYIPLKENAEAALKNCPDVHTVITVRRTGNDVTWNKSRDVWYHELVQDQESICPPEWMSAEDPSFILYTSGSTGKPKGVQHSTAGYLVHTAVTFKYVFDYHENDVYWCTADVGWITGHSYIIYGPLANGAITLMFEGVPTYPDASRCWEIIDRHKVNIFYTAPTALRQLMSQGNQYVEKTSRSSLQLLGTVGEPINPEAWEWYYSIVGKERCPIIDTWWQTETGGIMISPIPGVTPLKPGSASLPFFGVQPALLDEKGELISKTEGTGNLVISESWPSQIRTVYGDHQRAVDTYYSTYSGYYFTGDGARRDKDGYYWITGRVDDVINVSGHRVGTAEVESALVLHQDIAEAAVVGFPHSLKGEGIYAYVTLMVGIEATDEIQSELVKLVRSEIGPFAQPEVIQFSPGLPKTRSGKIMRRILRKIAANDVSDLGDTTTLADPTVIEDLLANRKSATE